MKGDPGDRGFKPKPILGLISPESSHTWPCICPENYEPISRQSLLTEPQVQEGDASLDPHTGSTAPWTRRGTHSRADRSTDMV